MTLFFRTDLLHIQYRKAEFKLATACLEGRLPHDHRSLLSNWLIEATCKHRCLCERT